jgi:hypothetical protein
MPQTQLDRLSGRSSASSDRLSDPLRDTSTCATEQDQSHQNSTVPLPHQSTPTERLTARRDFFRYSNRQFMILIITLSLCFAANRHNQVDDLVFLLRSVVSPTFLLTMMTLVAVLLSARAHRESRRVRAGR